MQLHHIEVHSFVHFKYHFNMIFVPSSIHPLLIMMVEIPHIQLSQDAARALSKPVVIEGCGKTSGIQLVSS